MANQTENEAPEENEYLQHVGEVAIPADLYRAKGMPALLGGLDFLIVQVSFNTATNCYHVFGCCSKFAMHIPGAEIQQYEFQYLLGKHN